LIVQIGQAIVGENPPT